MTYNYDFIEVVDYHGKKNLVNTCQIKIVSPYKCTGQDKPKAAIEMMDGAFVITDEPYESLMMRIVCRRITPDEGEK